MPGDSAPTLLYYSWTTRPQSHPSLCSPNTQAASIAFHKEADNFLKESPSTKSAANGNKRVATEGGSKPPTLFLNRASQTSLVTAPRNPTHPPLALSRVQVILGHGLFVNDPTRVAHAASPSNLTISYANARSTPMPAALSARCLAPFSTPSSLAPKPASPHSSAHQAPFRKPLPSSRLLLCYLWSRLSRLFS
ncbi:hypothetical protein ACGC1H_004992 [Rhizoctonia solani]